MFALGSHNATKVSPLWAGIFPSSGILSQRISVYPGLWVSHVKIFSPYLNNLPESGVHHAVS